MSNENAVSPEATGKFKHILVVEDHVALRFTLAEWLRSLNYIVHEAANADEATIILAAPITVDLVVTDVQMLGSMDGFGLVDFIRRTIPDLPVIVVSAVNYSREAKEREVVFFRKPYNFDTISSQIASMLGSAATKSKT